jgi:nucleolar GTP-binding protein
MIFEESLSLLQSITVAILIAVGILIWRFHVFKKKHFKHLTEIPSIIILGPESSGKTSLIKKLTKSEVFPDPIEDHLNIAYLENGGKKFQVVDGDITPRNLEQLKKLNYKLIVYVFDPSPNSIPIEEQIKNFEKLKKFFGYAKIFPVVNKTDIADGERLNKIKNEIQNFFKISVETGDGLEQLKKTLFH